jgi:hypothetical protein
VELNEPYTSHLFTYFTRTYKVPVLTAKKTSFPWVFRFLYCSVFMHWRCNVLNCRCLILYQYLHIVQSQSFVTTDGQSASLSWYKAPTWGLRPDLYFCQTVGGLLMWGVLSDERTGLSFASVIVSSNKPVVSMYNLHFTCMYIQHIQGLCQSRLSTADHALSLVAPAPTAA